MKHPAARHAREDVIFSHRNHYLFKPDDYPSVAPVEAEWLAIRKELDALLVKRDEIPNFQDLSHDQRVLTAGAQWKTFFLYGYGQQGEEKLPALSRNRAHSEKDSTNEDGDVFDFGAEEAHS